MAGYRKNLPKILPVLDKDMKPHYDSINFGLKSERRRR